MVLLLLLPVIWCCYLARALGIPQWRGAELAYSGAPEVAGAHAHRVRTAGVSIIGGCCGTSCEHLAAMRQAIDGHQKASRPTIETIVERIGPMKNTRAAAEGDAPARSRGRRRG